MSLPYAAECSTGVSRGRAPPSGYVFCRRPVLMGGQKPAMFERRSELLGLTCRLQDLALTALAFPVAYWVRIRILTRLVSPQLVRPDIYPLREYWALFIGTLVIWFVGGYVLRIYRDVELRNRQELAG